MKRCRQAASPPAGSAGQLSLVHTHPACGQMGAGVLWAADCLTNSTAQEDAASWAPLREVSPTGVPGLSHAGPAPGSREHPFRWHFCSLTHSMSPMVITVSGSLADMLSAVTPHQTSLAHSHLHSCMLVCNTAIAPTPLGAGF